LIIYRYLAREVLMTTMAVAGIVLAIALGWRFSGYLSDAARGVLTKEVLFVIMAYRLPGFLELIIPVSFFLSIMLAYGRLYVDSEMIVLEACGMSPSRLLVITLTLGSVVTGITAMLTLWVKPAAEARVELLFNDQRNLTEYDTLAPGRFQSLRNGERVTYTKELSGQGRLSEVFINEYKTTNFFGPKDVSTVVAASGTQRVDEHGNRFLVLNDGLRYSGEPGRPGYQVIEYEEYGQLIERKEVRKRAPRRSAIPTRDLIGAEGIRERAELNWRIGIILMVPVIAVMAVPLSRVNPRQGRFTRLVPGMFLCFLYVILLSTGRGALEKKQVPIEMGLWWVHAGFLLLVVVMFNWRRILRR